MSSSDDPMQHRPGLASNFVVWLLLAVAILGIGLVAWLVNSPEPALWPVAPTASASPTRSPDPSEDDPRWDCETMGSHSGCVLPGWDCARQGDGVCQFADLDAPGFWGRVLDIRDDYQRCLIMTEATELPAIICERLPHPSPSKAPIPTRNTFRGF